MWSYSHYLIARGISFVSSEKTPDAIAATTMIYRPGVTMHNVGLCQTIGRITVTARPDLKSMLQKMSLKIIKITMKIKSNI